MGPSFITIRNPFFKFLFCAIFLATRSKWPSRAPSQSSARDSCGIGFRGITRKCTGAWGFTSSNATHWKKRLNSISNYVLKKKRVCHVILASPVQLLWMHTRKTNNRFAYKIPQFTNHMYVWIIYSYMLNALIHKITAKIYFCIQAALFMPGCNFVMLNRTQLILPFVLDEVLKIFLGIFFFNYMLYCYIPTTRKITYRYLKKKRSGPIQELLIAKQLDKNNERK